MCTVPLEQMLEAGVVTATRLVLNSAVPAIRGKDYGKSKMKYPDYVETESGLQYKVCFHFFNMS